MCKQVELHCSVLAKQVNLNGKQWDFPSQGVPLSPHHEMHQVHFHMHKLREQGADFCLNSFSPELISEQVCSNSTNIQRHSGALSFSFRGALPAAVRSVLLLWAVSPLVYHWSKSKIISSRKYSWDRKYDVKNLLIVWFLFYNYKNEGWLLLPRLFSHPSLS